MAKSGWKRFWDRGGWWKALLFVAVYYGVYLALGNFIVAPLFSDFFGEEGTASYILLTTALPIVLACVVLVVFAISIGWLKELFGRQPIRGSWWMWIPVAVVLVFNVIHLFTIDYAEAGIDVVGSWLLAGLFIGFAEEVVTRGYVVNLMRRAGHREILVALASAGLFAAMHLGNVFTTTQGLPATLFQVGYTFFFGICMYLALRVTGTLIAPILLHASTDPTIFLSTEYSTGGALAAFGGVGNIVVIFTGLVLLFFIRGRVAKDAYGLPEGTFAAAGIPASTEK
ncbi:CPBP family intramembrane glutamic endopeptidase [Agromyces sp. PvR057]|uniref:CPBP family intramembrane glutamic endopeptidase n=1 Tax=Agromyces sp. PvR057 TaxID=3156403 RepID=UPI003394914C